MLYYVTGNKSKVDVAKKYLFPFSIDITQYSLELTEIQSDSLEEITLYKAQQAFEKVNEPLFVMDAGWYIPSLKGFPGPYMKYMNKWFTPEDFLNLIKPYNDRTIIYREIFCYKDKKQTKLFPCELKGRILEKPEGEGPNSWTLVTFRKDGKSIAKAWEEGVDPAENKEVWEELGKWIKSRSKH